MRYLYISLISCCLALTLPMANAQIITSVAGNGTSGFSGDGGQATMAELNAPAGIAIDSFGNIFIAEQFNNRVRKVNTAGIITTIAGNGTGGYSGDGGQATSAMLYTPTGLLFDKLWNLYIVDRDNYCIRKINTNGFIFTIAGIGGVQGFSGDGGQATLANLSNTGGLAFDALGNLFIGECGNRIVRKVDTGGIITTFAGTGTQGNTGDGGQANLADLNAPCFVSRDVAGNFYISDEINDNIRKINSSGIISTISNGSGINEPEMIVLDAAGNLYIADFLNNRIVMINTFGSFTTIVGTGTPGYSGDGGYATAAQLKAPFGITFDAIGNLYITDYENSVVRKVTNVAAAGIQQFATNNEQVTVYPNPAKDILHVECLMVNEKTSLTIMDMLGNTVKQIPFNTQQVTLKIGDLSEGVYNISITGKEGVTNKRVVIVR